MGELCRGPVFNPNLLGPESGRQRRRICYVAGRGRHVRASVCANTTHGGDGANYDDGSNDGPLHYSSATAIAKTARRMIHD
jgi:hypothetical protein